MFNDKFCKVMTFRDITAQTDLRQAQEKNKMTNLLVSNITHELLTPVRCISKMSKILQKSDLSNSDKRQCIMIDITAQLLFA